MYIHLGGEKTIRSEELVAILNAATFERPMMDNVTIEALDDQPAKSIIITTHKMYKSSISVKTLLKKVNKVSQLYRNG